MLTTLRRLEDSRTKNNSHLLDTLTANQYRTVESILNARLGKCVLYDYRNGCLYKRNMQPASINEISKAINKKVDKLFKTLSQKQIIKLVIDVRGREVWMINPDLYWDYVSYELYYNRWLWELGSHLGASMVIDSSLYHGYFYHSLTGEPVNKISRYHWFNMFKWWKLFNTNTSIDLLDNHALKASVRQSES